MQEEDQSATLPRTLNWANNDLGDESLSATSGSKKARRESEHALMSAACTRSGTEQKITYGEIGKGKY